jgi:hypothetical protein
MAARDPIIDRAASGSASTKNASAGRIKSFNGPGNTSSTVPKSQGKMSAPAPVSPYGKG